MRDKMTRIISTVLGIGYLPLMPGTFSSAAGAACYLLIKDSAPIQAAAAAFVTIAGFMTASRAERLFGKTDPKEIVIDELSGMLFSYLFIPYCPFNLVAGFFIFRAIDIFKVYPANRLEGLGGARGIMLDDIAGGIMTNIILRAIMLLWGLF